MSEWKLKSTRPNLVFYFYCECAEEHEFLESLREGYELHAKSMKALANSTPDLPSAEWIKPDLMRITIPNRSVHS